MSCRSRTRPGPATQPTGCTNGVQLDPNIPTYDSFFGSTLGSGATGDGLSGATPSAKKTGQLMAYMQAVVNAINSNPSTTGQRVAAKIVQEGTSVLGTPFDYVVIGTPGNIANLDSGRNDQAFWRGVIDGTDVATGQALAQVRSRPAFALDHRRAARQRARRRRGVRQGAVRAGGPHRLRQRGRG